MLAKKETTNSNRISRHQENKHALETQEINFNSITNQTNNHFLNRENEISRCHLQYFSFILNKTDCKTNFPY